MIEKVTAELILDIKVECSERIPVGENINGDLGVIPIIGGVFDGKIKGKVINGGADWNRVKSSRIASVDAKYTLKTEDGYYICIENQGLIDNSQEAEFKTNTSFHVSEDSPYDFLNSGVYVGKLNSGEKVGSVNIKIYHLL